jgi:myxalamid-type nonribosomal peptide synthetase MxaA
MFLDLAELLESVAKTFPSRIAVQTWEHGTISKKLSYSELLNASRQKSKTLQTLHVRPGSRVVILADNSLDWVLAFFGVMFCRGSVVALDTQNDGASYVKFIQYADAVCVLTTPDLFRKIDPQLLNALPPVLNISNCQPLPGSASVPSQNVTGDGDGSVALIAFTSGTTGTPKGIMLEHKAILTSARIFEQLHGSSEDSVLCLLPLSHSFAICGVLITSLSLGAEVTLLSEVHAEALMAAAQVTRPTLLPLVPRLVELLHNRIFQQMANQARWKQSVFRDLMLVNRVLFWVTRHNFGPHFFKPIHQRFGGRLRAILVGAAPSDPHITRDMIDIGLVVVDGYGITEAAGPVFINDPKSPRVGTVGKPFPWQVIQISNPDADGNGEVCLRAPSLMKGYFRNPEASAAALHGGFLHTGDLGHLTRAGHLILSGRLKELIVTAAGLKLEPAALDRLYQDLPGITELATFGVPVSSTSSSETIHVAVVVSADLRMRYPKMPALQEAVDALFQERGASLLPHQRISTVHIVDSLPRTRTLKIKRLSLKQLSTADSAPPLQDSNEDERFVLTLLANLMRVPVETLNPRRPLIALGVDSLIAMELKTALENKFGIALSNDFLFDIRPLSALVAEISTLRQDPRQTVEQAKRPHFEPSKLPPATPQLSFGQERLWFLDHYYHGLALYNVGLAIRLLGQLDRDALTRACQNLIKRHAILRTCYPEMGGTPELRTEPEFAITLPVENVANSNVSDVRGLLDRDIRQPFDLGRCPLFRFKLYELGGNEHVFLIAMHHIISDGSSLLLLVRELATLYNGGEGNADHQEGAYTDFAAWQRQVLTGSYFRNLQERCLDTIRSYPFLLEIPGDHPRRAVQPKIEKLPFTFTSELSQRLQKTAEEEAVTLYVVLLGAFQLLLYRYAFQDKFLVGTPVSGRDEALTRSLPGFFVNTVAIPADLSGNTSVAVFLQKLQQHVRWAYEHQELPLDRLIASLDLPRSTLHEPLFQVFFALQNFRVPEGGFEGLTSQYYHSDNGRLPYDISFEVMSFLDDGFSAVISYNAQIFDKPSIIRLSRHYQNILESMVQNRTQALSMLSMLDASEKKTILYDWNATDVPFPQDVVVHALFEEQVRKQPTAPALRFAGQTLSYQELDGRANQFAHHLRSLGAGPDQIVAVVLERSLDFVTVLLGIAKSGAAYLPIDPSFPKERIAFMIEDASASIVITSLPIEALASYPTTPVVSSVNASNLFYVIYTSGSTGQPKGVLNIHRGAINRLLWMQREYKVGRHDVILQKTPYTFDVSVWEIFLPLISGSTLVLAKPGGHKDVAYLNALIVAETISILHFVPSMLQIFLNFQDKPWPSCPLKKVFVSGEALSWALQEQFFSLFENVELHNLYGPTEASIDVTYWQCRSDHPGSVPLGRPIANTQVHVLGKNLEPLPQGALGEIYLGGVGLARGYLKRENLDSERFVKNPFSENPGDRLYKTADLGRYQPDGVIEYWGRLDTQVKIRGVRIELGEIESTLLSLGSLGEAAVLASDDSGENKNLLAFVVPRNGVTLDVEELREALRQKLPDYMLPHEYYVVSQLPLTTNGKLDRKALLAQRKTAFTSRTPAFTPRRPLEQELARLWKEVLHKEQIGSHEDFFAAGGDSLLAVRLMVAIRSRLHIALTMSNLFEKRTFDSLAAYLEEMQLAPRLRTERKRTRLLAQDVVLDPVVRYDGPKPTQSLRSVFLTGATGFVGAFLLQRLIESGMVQRCYCLCKAENDHAALERIRHNLQVYGIWKDSYSSFIVPVNGDLAQPLLGQSPGSFQALAEECDAIFHSGALVNFVLPYESLRDSNVTGTHEVLRLTASGKSKVLHYLSTVSVFPETAQLGRNVVEEYDTLDFDATLDTAYAETKWVAEQLVTTARSRGLHVNIYRLGRIAGDSSSGVSNANDLVSRMISSCLDLACVPRINTLIDLTPVDAACDAVLALARNPQARGGNYHIVHPAPVPFSYVASTLEQEGYRIQELAYAQWLKKLEAAAENGRKQAILPLLGAFPREQTDTLDLLLPRFATEQTCSLLPGRVLTTASVPELLKRYVRFLKRTQGS